MSPGKWLVDEIHAFVSDGAAAPMGWTVTLCTHSATQAWKPLLNFWTMRISDTGPPAGRKHVLCSYPNLQSLHTCYRMWSRKHAHALLKWLNSWAPSSLVGSRRGFSADATAQDVAGIINRARAGERPPLYVLSLDQSKFFDTLSLPKLKEFCRRAGLQQAEYILEVYCGLGRQLWIDGAPTSSVLQSENACGIPQGFPAACFFANASAMIWPQVVSNPRLMALVELLLARA